MCHNLGFSTSGPSKVLNCLHFLLEKWVMFQVLALLMIKSVVQSACSPPRKPFIAWSPSPCVPALLPNQVIATYGLPDHAPASAEALYCVVVVAVRPCPPSQVLYCLHFLLVKIVMLQVLALPTVSKPRCQHLQALKDAVLSAFSACKFCDVAGSGSSNCVKT